MYTAEPLEDISRFNWAEGFYDPEKIAQYKKPILIAKLFLSRDLEDRKALKIGKEILFMKEIKN